MKRLFLLIFGLLSLSIVFSQPLTGIKTIKFTGGNYSSFTAAVNALNNNGVGSGGVTFNVDAGFRDTVANLNITTKTTSAANPIVFRKSGTGKNPVIVAGSGSGTMDAIIKLSGTDFITFDGINLIESSKNSNNNSQMEWGYAILKSNNPTIDGCKFVTIKNCSISLNTNNNLSPTTSGIYIANHIASVTTDLIPTDTNGINSHIRIFNDTISNAYTGIYLSGYPNAGAPYDLYDQDNQIGVGGANVISNFGGSMTTCYGIYTSYQNNLKIANNNISGSGLIGTAYGIMMSTATSSNADLYNNVLSINYASTTSAAYGIYSSMGSTASNNKIRIYGNTIQNTSNIIATSGTFYGIYNSGYPDSLLIYNNTLSNITFTGSGSAYGIYVSAPLTNGVLIYGNNITHFSRSSGSGTIYGYYQTTTATNSNISFYNNLIRYIGNLVSSSTVYGVYFNPSSSVNANIYNNIIDSLGSTGGTIYGLYTLSGNYVNIYKNRINALYTTSGTTYGCYISGGTSSFFYNNFISDLIASSSTNVNAVNGLYINGGTNVKAYFNTIFLNANTSSTSTFGTAGIYASTTPVVELSNNIVVNSSTVGKTGGKATAYQRSGTSLTTYASTSDNNCFYAGVPSVINVLYWDGTNADQTIAAYKTRMAPREAYSFTERPPFANISTKPFDLHLSTTAATRCESGGKPANIFPYVASTDIDGNLRNSTYPDVGADEGAYTILDQIQPRFTYTLLPNTSSTSARTILATIQDPSGVPRNGAGKPVLYWRKNNTGTWNSATSTFLGGYQFSLSFGAAVATGDSVVYYFVAQDSATTPNIGSSPSTGATGFTANPPAASTAPAQLNTYKIVPGFAAGNYNIGGTGTTPSSGCTYVDITAALKDIGQKEITGTVTLNLTATYKCKEEDSYPIVINPILGSGPTKRLIIKPAAGTNDTITAVANSSIIMLNGADYVVIDGSNNGTTSRNLFIQNTSTSSFATTIMIASQGSGNGSTYDTIKNCFILGGTTFGNMNSAIAIANIIPGGGDDNDNITIQNNIIQNAYYGIYAAGTISGVMKNLSIKNNIIGTISSINKIGFSGIYLPGYANNTMISDNEVLGITSIRSFDAIYIGNGITNSTFMRNSIHDLTNTNTERAAGFNISTGSNANLNFYNNILYNIISNSSAGKANGNFGFYITGGSGYNFYYNSVYLSGNREVVGSNLPNILSAAFMITGGGGMILINNILVNTQVAPTFDPKSYSIYSSTPTSPFTTINNNDYFVSGTQGVLGNFGGVDITTLAAWKNVTGQDANSISADPLYNSLSNLQPYSGSAVLGAGSYVATVTTDILGTSRSVATPTIGAYENAGDYTGPVINFTPFMNTSSTTSRILTATITDNTGVSTSGAGLPRLYWKKNPTGSWTGVTATSIGANQYNFSFGSGVASGDSVFYYVVAQDNSVNVNVSCKPSAGASGFTVNPPAASTPTNAPNSYKIVGSISGGSYNIGGTGITPAPGCTYVDLTAAFADINTKEITGPVKLNLTSYYKYSEEDAFPIVINPTAGSSNTNRITIKPASGTNDSIIGNSATSIFKINGADYLTIDGSNNGTNSRNLYIGNLYNTGLNAVIWLSSLGADNGCTYDSIKNCVIRSGNKTAVSVGITVGGTIGSTGEDNNYNTFQNNVVLNSYCAIYVGGTGNANAQNLSLINNVLGSTAPIDQNGYYGLFLAYVNNSLIQDNDIFGITYTPTIFAVNLIAITNCTFNRNKVHDLKNTGSGGVNGFYINCGTNANLSFYNNLLYNIINCGSIGNGSFGFFVANGSGYNFYYNSVYMSGNRDSVSTTNKPTSISAAFYAGSGSGMYLKNNIFMNTQTAATNNPKSYAFYSNVPASSYLSLNYNDYYTSGSQGVLGNISGSDYTTLSGWASATGRDTNSINSDPILNSTTNLQPNVGSAVLGAGIPVTAITTDYINVARSSSKPSIGAYENGADWTAPVITYTPLQNTSSTSSRNLIATITDNGSVPTSGIGLPRLFWKKNYVGSWSAVTATYSGSSQYSFALGSGVSSGDTVFYYVVAQDGWTPANMAINPSAGSVLTPNPPTATPIPSAPNYYRIVPFMAGGNYNIGGTGVTPAVGCTYVDLTAAFADISGKMISGSITLNLTSYYKSSEENSFPIIIPPISGSSATNFVKIKPASGTTDTIRGNSTSSILMLNGADYIIIDGSNNNSNSKNLVIENTAKSGTVAAIHIASTGNNAGAIYNTIKNCIINTASGSNTTSFGIFSGGSVISTSGTGSDNDNLIINNNTICKSYYGIYAAGNPTGMNDSNVIIGNLIGSTTASDKIGYCGILVKNATNSRIGQNIIFNINGTVMNPVGISVGTGYINSTIDRNKIYDIIYTDNSGYGGKGIDLNSAGSLKIHNNLIYNISGDGSYDNNNSICGIRIASGSNYSIYHNTVNLAGNINNTAAINDFSSAICILSGVSNIKLKNNIFSNSINNISGSSNAYAIYTNASSSPFSQIDYNNYFASGAQGMLGYFLNDQSTIQDWKTATNKDTNSMSSNPNFKSTTDLHPRNPFMNNTAVPLASITDDYDGITRSTTIPDRGAFEFALDIPLRLIYSAVTTNSAVISAIVNPVNEGVANVRFEFGRTTAYGTNLTPTPSTTTGFLDDTFDINKTGLDPATIYHFRAYAYNSNGTYYSTDTFFKTKTAVPLVVTGTKNSVTSTTAVLNGTVNAQNDSASVVFEYGTTTAYGSTKTAIPAKTGGMTAVAVSTNLSGLNSNTTYHYRLKATNGGGSGYGSDSTFTTKAIPPVAITDKTTFISSTKATLNGRLNPNNLSTNVYFEYGTTPAYGSIATPTPSVYNGSILTSVSYNLSGLLINTTYFYRFVAVNAAGTVYGYDSFFKTGNNTPDVITGTVSGITSNSAGIFGSVLAYGDSATVEFEYGLTNAYGNNITATPKKVGGLVYANVSANLTGLIPNTTYHYRVKATNTGGSGIGIDSVFKTKMVAPKAITNTASSITSSDANLNATINPNNLVSQAHFEYGTTISYGSSIAVTPSNLYGNNDTNVRVSITSLSPYTTYHYRIVAINAAGTTNGNDMTFRSLPIKPMVITDKATNITYNNATLNGIVNPNIDSSTVYFEYGLTTAYGNNVNAIPNIVSGSSNVAVSAIIPVTTHSTTYHYRLVATNKAGTSYGSDSTFKTTSGVPVLTTDNVTSIAKLSASCGGTITTDSGSAVTSRGLCWSTLTKPTIALPTKVAIGSGTGHFGGVITGLVVNTKYYVRAYATNAAGTGYGDEKSFTTLPSSIIEDKNGNQVIIGSYNTQVIIGIELIGGVKASMSLYNAVGQEVISKHNLDNGLNNIVPEQSISKGVYLVRITTTDQQVFCKQVYLD